MNGVWLSDGSTQVFALAFCLVKKKCNNVWSPSLQENDPIRFGGNSFHLNVHGTRN